MEEEWLQIPQRRKEDNFNLGAKKKNIKITFPDFVNYYIGIEDACQNLNISKSTFLKWKNDISLTKGRIISIEYIDNLPESFTNFEIKIEKISIPKKVRILFFDGRIEEYDTCKEADLSIGLPIGTV